MIDGGPTIVIIIVYYILFILCICLFGHLFSGGHIYFIWGEIYWLYKENGRAKNGVVNNYFIILSNKGGVHYYMFFIVSPIELKIISLFCVSTVRVP